MGVQELQEFRSADDSFECCKQNIGKTFVPHVQGLYTPFGSFHFAISPVIGGQKRALAS